MDQEMNGFAMTIDVATRGGGWRVATMPGESTFNNDRNRREDIFLVTCVRHLKCSIVKGNAKKIYVRVNLRWGWLGKIHK
jgi:hypothetical protein